MATHLLNSRSFQLNKEEKSDEEKEEKVHYHSQGQKFNWDHKNYKKEEKAKSET